MIRLPLSLLTGFAAAALCSAALAENEPPAGFTALFNGKDLTGWRYGGTKEAPAKSGKGYQVESGILYCTAADGGNLYTEKEYANFVLRFDFKLEAHSNNGIAIR